jgi:intein-encoded DNA endonuclease-like protein
MELNEINREALEFGTQDIQELSNKILELKNKGVSFLGCVAFVQTSQKLTLSEAREMTLKLDCWTENDRNSTDFYHKLMMSEFDEEE